MSRFHPTEHQKRLWRCLANQGHLGMDANAIPDTKEAFDAYARAGKLNEEFAHKGIPFRVHVVPLYERPA